MYRFSIAILTVIIVFFNINFVSAQNFEDFSGLKNIAGETGAGYDTSKVSLIQTIGTIIQYTLSFLGVIMLCVVLVGYFILSNAGGDEEKVKQAKSWI